MDEIGLLIDSAIKGDTDAPKKIFEHYSEAAKKIANYYAKRYPRKRHDLQCVAMAGLFHCVRKLCDGHLTHSEYDKYVKVTVRGHIRRHIETDTLIPVPRHVYKVMLENSETPVQVLSQDETFLKGTKPCCESIELSFADCYTILDTTPKEQKILALRMAGYTLSEVACELKCGTSSVHRTLEDLKIKYLIASRKGLLPSPRKVDLYGHC
jgi:DNA-binding CsgD family transcriptional regulator